MACLNGEGVRLVREADAGFAIPAEDANGLVEGHIATLQNVPYGTGKKWGATSEPIIGNILIMID